MIAASIWKYGLLNGEGLMASFYGKVVSKYQLSGDIEHLQKYLCGGIHK
jgi:hypothetical protein